jgi:hypothetical protein
MAGPVVHLDKRERRVWSQEWNRQECMKIRDLGYIEKF